MAEIKDSEEFTEFEKWSTELKQAVGKWPLRDDNALTTYIPDLTNLLQNGPSRTADLQGVVDRVEVGGSGEVETTAIKELIQGLSKGLIALSEMLSDTSGALSCTYNRLHGRGAPSWEVIGSMWQTNKTDILRTPAQRATYTDEINGETLAPLRDVILEAAGIVSCLVALISVGEDLIKKSQDHGMKLADPLKVYQSDADDEAESE